MVLKPASVFSVEELEDPTGEAGSLLHATNTKNTKYIDISDNLLIFLKCFISPTQFKSQHVCEPEILLITLTSNAQHPTLNIELPSAQYQNTWTLNVRCSMFDVGLDLKL
jgi:hypothetical protein